MKQLPDRPSLEHLKKQAKELLRLYRSRDPAATTRFRDALPAAAGKDDVAIAALALRLSDAQSCIAREYGFLSWADLHGYVEARAGGDDRDQRLMAWLRFVYAGEVAGGNNRARPLVAVRMLSESPELAAGDAYLACAVGDEAGLRQQTKTDPAWVNRAGGRLNLPPLVAVTHSSLLRLPQFRDRLLGCARFLLDAGADPQQSIGNRWPPASLRAPSVTERLSPLYGAAGQNHDPQLTKILLDAGADPNDGESLYHSLEDIACVRLLLEAGARVDGSNALYRVLDLDDVAVLRLLLAHGANANEPARNAPLTDWGSPLLWAIRRRRSRAHIEALLQAGADAAATTPDGASGHRLALRFGLSDVAELLHTRADAPLSDEEQLIAACARGDEPAARRVLAKRPDLPRALTPTQLRLLPDLAGEGCNNAVELMVTLGWPIATRGGDWQASALNLAVFRGDAELTRFLLQHGASWTEQQGFDDNVCGTLSWASCNEPSADGDWAGCAAALLAHGMPGAQLDPDAPDHVIIDGHSRRFSDDVTEILVGNRQ